jgi:hypothetical protein
MRLGLKLDFPTEMTQLILLPTLCWQAVWNDVAQLAGRALVGALALWLIAILFDQFCRRLWYRRLIGGNYHEVDRPERKIRVRYRRLLTFKAVCTENGIALWTSVFSYDRLTRLGLGNYYYQNGANPNDWGEHRLHFENHEVRGIDRNVGGGKDEVRLIHWVRD